LEWFYSCEFVSDFSSQLYNRSCFYVNAKDTPTPFLSIYYNTPSNLKMIVLVGGFSGCKIIQENIKSFFPSHRVIVPEDAELAVLKGAVLFGHKPDYIVARIARYTYGVKTRRKFNPLMGLVRQLLRFLILYNLLHLYIVDTQLLTEKFEMILYFGMVL
jgi:hypothetical protein